MEMNRTHLVWLGVGAGLAAAAGTVMLRRGAPARRRRQAIRAISRAADELGGILKIF